MPNLFNSIKLTKPGKSNFDLSHDVKLSFKIGELVPIMVIDCIPGDKFNISCDSLTRFAPLVAPPMHRMDQRIEYYFVPNRLLWPNWERFISNNGNEPIGNPLPAFPTLQVDFAAYTQLHDYLGIPTPPNPTTDPPLVSALPFAAYQMIYNEYYRDQNLIDDVIFELQDGSNDANGMLTQLRNRAWEHDYFTSALPFAQKGAVVSMPVELTDAPVKIDLDPTIVAADLLVSATQLPGGGVGDFSLPKQLSADAGTQAGELYADNSGVVGQTTINDLRRATKLQEWLEKIARGGSRMTEVIRTFFGVKSSDQRLDRPEYITGTKSPVIISEVLSTAETTSNPQGNMAGHAVSVTNGNYGGYFCEEHGYIIGIMSVMPKTAYQQGIPKHFLKTADPFQFYWPQFENIGEQPIENQEIYAYTADPQETFGYIPRYSEYKFMLNRVAGEFRTSLDFWHMGRIFDSQPQLNQDFIEVDPNSDTVNRIFAVTDPFAEKLYCHILNKIRAIRPMSKYGNPMF